jgi:hypothetical protein
MKVSNTKTCKEEEKGGRGWILITELREKEMVLVCIYDSTQFHRKCSSVVKIDFNLLFLFYFFYFFIFTRWRTSSK